MNKKERLKLLNISIDTYEMDEAVVLLDQFIQEGKRAHCAFAANPEKNFSIMSDKKLYEVFNSADLLIPDGIGMVIAARILTNKRVSRVPGVELMEKLCNLSERKGYGIYVYGASEDVNKKAVEELKRRYKDIKIVGRSNGYIKQNEMNNLIKKINDSHAKILFLALGSPRQEKWYADHKNRLTSVKLCQGVGGSLDVLSGNVKRAPLWWRNRNLEWLYRLIKEPKRIKRQKILPKFIFHVFLKKLTMSVHGLRQE